jgi:hypothetical protein
MGRDTTDVGKWEQAQEGCSTDHAQRMKRSERRGEQGGTGTRERNWGLGSIPRNVAVFLILKMGAKRVMCAPI